MTYLIRFLLDENINYPDTIIFTFAMAEGYIIVTNNIYEFRPLHEAWTPEHESPGIVFVPNRWRRNPYRIAGTLINVHDHYVYPGMEWWVGSEV